jgi:hypothetical protein
MTRPTLLWGAAVAGLVAIGIILAVTLGGGGGTDKPDVGSAKAALTSAGCTFTSTKALASADHSVADPAGTSGKWNTNPPTSGPHNAQPALWGAYTSPLNQAQVVHNLEHGGIFIQYGSDVPDATVAELTAFWDDHQPGTLLAPLPRLGDKIALGAWTQIEDDGQGVLAKCTSFDKGAYTAFFDEFQFKGPERFNPSDLMPGT